MLRTKFFVAIFSTSLLAFSLAPAVAQPSGDAPGCKDHPLVTRMANMRIANCKSFEFDTFAFKTGIKSTEAVEGRKLEQRYQITTGNLVPSKLAIIRNHQQAFAAIGGTTKYEDSRYIVLNVTKNGKEVWVQVDTAVGLGYVLTIVEKQAMVQEVTASAAVFEAGLKSTGHVEVPGIFFDTGKAELKPESATAIGEVAKLLKAEPALKVFVVGHTDNTASLDLNMKLSQARAESVVQALVSQHGIAAARLMGRGAGPLAPVASNDSEDGRAKNRRVELVKQ